MNSKVIQQYQIELFGTEVDLSDTNQQRGRQTRPKHHTYKDYLDSLFLLSNRTWRRAHVKAGFSGRDPNVKVNALLEDKKLDSNLHIWRLYKRDTSVYISENIKQISTSVLLSRYVCS